MTEATKAARAMKQAKTHEEFHRASLQYVQALKNKPTPPNPDAPEAKTMTTAPFKKTVFLGTTAAGRLTVAIDWDGQRLSITGSEGRDHGGQIIMSPWDFVTYAEGYNAETVQQLRDTWEAWHLNDMNAGSPAQTAYLKAHPVPYRADHYTATVEALTAAGLNPAPDYIHNGKPYEYGTAWLFAPVPAAVVQWLHELP